MHTDRHTHIHIHTHTYRQTHTHTHTHTNKYTHTHTQINTYIHIHTYIHTHRHTHKQIHRHTHDELVLRGEGQGRQVGLRAHVWPHVPVPHRAREGQVAIHAVDACVLDGLSRPVTPPVPRDDTSQALNCRTRQTNRQQIDRQWRSL